MDFLQILRKLNYILLIFFNFLGYVSPAEITTLWMPGPFREGNRTSVILDCIYTYEEEDRDSLEVTWYFRQGEVNILCT